MDISISATKVNGRPKGRPAGHGYTGVMEHPPAKRIPHVSKVLHSLASSYFRKATDARSVIGQKDV